MITQCWIKCWPKNGKFNCHCFENTNLYVYHRVVTRYFFFHYWSSLPTFLILDSNSMTSFGPWSHKNGAAWSLIPPAKNCWSRFHGLWSLIMGSLWSQIPPLWSLISHTSLLPCYWISSYKLPIFTLTSKQVPKLLQSCINKYSGTSI